MLSAEKGLVMVDETDRIWAGSMPEAYDRWLVPAVFRPFAADSGGTSGAG